VAVNTSDSSSEEETDDEADDPAANNSIGATIFGYDNAIEDADSNAENLETNELLDNLIWRFDEYEHTDDRLRLPSHMKTVYPRKTELNTGVATSFKTPLGAFKVMGGFDVDTAKRLCRNSNDYMKMFVLSNRTTRSLHGAQFEDITLLEMMKFLGIILRMSLNPIDYGGYPAYFFSSDADIVLNEEQKIKASGTEG